MSMHVGAGKPASSTKKQGVALIAVAALIIAGFANASSVFANESNDADEQQCEEQSGGDEDRSSNQDRASRSGDRSTDADEQEDEEEGGEDEEQQEEEGNEEEEQQEEEECQDEAGNEDEANNGLDILGNTCADSQLGLHAGFQDVGEVCVPIGMGEISDVDKNPSLLITDSPEQVEVDEEFELKVSTRNLVRDRFLGAAEGGYYLESSFLDANGLQRGHFHTACRILDSEDEAPDAEPEPAFFEATEDGGGGAGSDEVTLTVPGIPEEGVVQCASWAGDGSHRTPMMQRANQTPAFDTVRIEVSGGGNNEEEEEHESSNQSSSNDQQFRFNR